MSLNQDIQKKAQTEIDLVVGPDRLPTHNDRNELPFVNAIVKESEASITRLRLARTSRLQQRQAIDPSLRFRNLAWRVLD